ncbi:hypothetical protein DRP05_07740 [Archaeoglobales archaeon]|nr:MAG: hypothetical protein DRP05_07740 [Archaeoglobales archaeon]
MIAEMGGTAFKDDILEAKPEWSEMKVTGLLAGINNRSRRLGFTDMVKRIDAKKDRHWTSKYILNKKCMEFLKEIAGG